MKNTWSAIIWTVTALVVLLVIYTASGHASERGDFFKGLMQPDTGISCCDISDCALTKDYRYEDGQWVALAVHEGFYSAWLPIPENKILAERKRPEGVDPDDAILCTAVSSPNVYCFLPPNLGF